MIGAIAGDIIGSVYEFSGSRDEDFPFFDLDAVFTDDTVMTVAIAEAILNGGDYADSMRKWGQAYPDAGYGGMFYRWVLGEKAGPYNSFGNGSAMRVSPVGFAFNTEKEVLEEAKRSAECTHNHPEGIKGAQSTALAIWLARQGVGKDVIRKEIVGRFQYDLTMTLREMRQSHRMSETCQGTMPVCFVAFFESISYEDAIRKAIAVGGDMDTQGAIVGGIAQAFYKTIPGEILRRSKERLTPDLLAVLDRFNEEFSL
ncbi:MAG: ADP-ribosylglycohydrolase family protein [Candidatus Omnitrophica bacterium]|nr:ADP-ribosylglycohydrolase family protein [Candidatus Omnitrophota bacterium]